MPNAVFVDEHAPIVLETDASDFGIGGYLYQVINGEQQPIAIYSKALTKERLRWNVAEKECFAIVHALTIWDYLLRDVHFTLRTDHKNLTYIYTTGSPKVVRWKLHIQEYDFTVEHIKGELNVVADGLSRMVPQEGSESMNVVAESSRVHIPAKIYRIIQKCHNAVVGHGGFERTCRRVQEEKEIRLRI